MPSPVYTPQPTSPPAWAIEIMNDLKTIKHSVSKIGNIEKLINKVNQKVEQLDLKLKNIESRVDETKKLVQIY